MCHVRGIWTNGLWGMSKETDVYLDTMRLKLAPDVSRIHIQHALDGEEAWVEEADVVL